MKKGNGNSFIFSFSEKTKHKNINPLKETNSTFSYFSFGLDDIRIFDNFDTNFCIAKIGNSYQAPQGMIPNSKEAVNYLGGTS